MGLLLSPAVMDLLQLLGDLDVLGAGGDAGSALDAAGLVPLLQGPVLVHGPDTVTVQLGPVVHGEDVGDGDVIGADRAVAAAGAVDGEISAHPVAGGDGLGVRLLAEHSGSGAGGVGHVLLHLLGVAHAGQDHIDLLVVPQEVQCALHRSLGQQLGHIRRHIGQGTAPQGLHDDHAQALLVGQTHALQARLIVHIQVVELDLAELPAVIGVQDALERLQIVVEAETDVADLAVALGLFHLLDDLELLHALPAVIAEGVHQVQVDVVGLQPLQLLIQDTVITVPYIGGKKLS